MFKDSKIFVAGHTGLLGSALMRRLGKRGYANIVTRTHEELDLTRQAAVEDFFASERPGVVFLAAGLSGGIGANIARPAEFLQVNLAMQVNVFEAARRSGVRAVVFYGSSCAYPKTLQRPIREEDLLTGPVEETSAPYAAAKIAGLLACKAYNAQYGSTKYIALVPNSIYGPGDAFDLKRAHVLGALVARIYDAKRRGFPFLVLWGTGNPRREFIYSDDAADASIFAVENSGRLGDAHYNLGTGVDCSIKELACLIAKEAGYKGEILWDSSKPDGTEKKLLDSSRFASLGWAPGIGLEEGVRRTCEWYQETREAALKEKALSGF